MIFILITGGRDKPAWAADDVVERMVHAMKLDRLSPKLRGPKGTGNAYLALPDDWHEPDPTAKPLDASRAPLLRAEREFADDVLAWFAYLADESEQTRRTFAVWLRSKAAGYGAMKVWQAKHGVLNGSVAHARNRCVATIVKALNAEHVARVAIPNPGRFEKPMRKAA